MLSYQHAYHAGNLADIHKHGLLAATLEYLTRKDKPLTYLETHAGRGLYDLASRESRQTTEAEAGITRALAQGWLPEGHPYMLALREIRTEYGPNAYPGSPLIAKAFLRPQDRAHLAELHPAEFAALIQVVGFASTYHQDGKQMANAICPPTPRRGLMLIDPSYEIKADYDDMPRFIGQITRKWNVGVILLWYPILRDMRHLSMTAALTTAFPQALLSEVSFPPIAAGHALTGSGMFIMNPPWNAQTAAHDLSRMFLQLG